MRSELDQSAAIVAAEFGSDGTYVPQAGASLELTRAAGTGPVMTYGISEIGDSVSSERADVADIRMDVLTEPSVGDSLVVGDDAYAVDAFQRTGSLWRLTLRYLPQGIPQGPGLPFFLSDGRQDNIAPINDTQIPHYLTDGTEAHIDILDGAMPFYLSDGTPSPIDVVTENG